MTAGCSQEKGDVIDTEDLLAYFKFDSTENNKVKDEISSKNFDLEYIFKNAAYKQSSNVPCVEGVVNKAISFDGNSVSFLSDPINFGNEDFSITFFVAPRAYERNDGQYTALFTNLSDGGGIEISMAQYGNWKVTISTTKGTLSAVMSGDDILPLYDWSYIAVRYFKQNGTLQVFLNNKLVNSLNFKNNNFIPSPGKIYIGKSIACMDFSGHQLNHFNGLIDELKIYKGAVSDNKIKENSDLALLKKRSSGITFSYETLSDDRYAPQYHMRNPQSWANEHYGAFYYNGLYHVFSQHNPFRAYYQNGQRWGHLVSEDLVHWKALTPALTPSNNHIDNSQTFSGSCTIDGNGNPIMFYTGVNEGNEFFNSISYARPKDLNDKELVTWVKSNEKIINQGSISNRFEFRDPFIYKENGKCFMLIGGNASPVNGNNGAVYIYQANNKEYTSWNYLGMCYSGDTSTYPDLLGSTYELPNLYKIYSKDKTKSKYMLMVSPIYGNCNSVTYWLGNFDLQTGVFTPDDAKPRRYDLGPTSMVLAASGFYDEKNDRNLFTTMMRTGISDEDSYLCNWNDCQTLWKEIYLDDNGEACFSPISEYSSLSKEELLSFDECKLTITQANEMLKTIHSDSYKLEVEFELNEDEKVGAYVKNDEKKGEQIFYSYDMTTKIFHCDTSHSSLLLKNLPSGGGIQNLNGDLVKLTIFVDRSMVECYLNDKNEIATMAWNKNKDADSLKLYCKSGKAIIKKMKIVSLTGAYGCDKPAYWGE